MLKKIIAGIFIVSVFTGCLKGEDLPNPCDFDVCSVKAPDSEIQAVADYLTANNIVAIEHCSGVFYAVEVQGTGATPQACSNITVNYEGRLTNGTLFDNSNNPVTFNLSEVITGWRTAIPQAKAGGRIYLFIPPSLGYGNAQQGTIPPNSILVFKVDLIAVQ